MIQNLFGFEASTKTLRKKIFLFGAMVVASLSAGAQNIQLHYDFGRHIYHDEEADRQNVTLTFEGFSADKLGSWYYFVDIDATKNGVISGYTEVSREFTFAKVRQNNAFAAHIEYDGGLSKAAGTFQSAVLVGPAWNGHNADYSTTYSIQAMYKQFFGQAKEFNGGARRYASFQLTGVWSTTFAKKKCTFSGFIDLWRGKRASNGHGTLVVLAEPQFWYNITRKISVGTEWEFSNHFIYRGVSTGVDNDKFYFNPTLAFKFNL